jgi:hypothetical protein
MSANELRITAHCLLRLTAALTLEAAGIVHGQGNATAELNNLSGQRRTSAEWLAILEPRFNARFGPQEMAGSQGL